MRDTRLPLRERLRRQFFQWAFKAWCKTPRWLALRRWYLPFYGRVGWWLDDHAYGHMRDEWEALGA